MNLDLLSLNLKSKSKYTTPRIPKKTNLIIEKKKKLYSSPNSAKKSNFIPPLAIPLSDLDDFEDRSDRKSSHVKFLTEQKDYSTPRSIRTFIMYNNGDSHYSDNAIKIQRCWRAYIKRKRFANFINFIFKVRRKRIKFAFHLWILSLQKPADVSKYSYQQVISFLLSYGYIIKQGKNQNLMTKDQFYNVNNFNQSMRTDFILIQPRYPSKIIQRYQKNFYRPLIQNIFSQWSSITSEKLALKRTSRPLQELAKKRFLFGPMFWTFYFWKRWAAFKKTGKIPSNSNQMFITEWSIYISKKKEVMKLNKSADKIHQRFIKSIIVTNLRINSANRSVYNKACENFERNRENLLMMTSLRAFNVVIAVKKFNLNIKRRIIREWYKAIDLQITSRMKETVLQNRGFLKSLTTSLKKWQNYTIEEGLKTTYLHDLVTQNNLLMLKTFFLLKSDFHHFAFISAFFFWKKLLIMNHNKRKFINWSLTKGKKKAVLQSLFNIFKQHAAIHTKYSKFHPFGNTNDIHMNNVLTPKSQKIENKKKLLKAKKRISENLPTVKVYLTSQHQTIRAYSNLNEFEMCNVNWHKEISSDEVKTLFYQIILILSNKKISSKSDMNSDLQIQKEKIEKLKKFRSNNLLFNANEIHGFKIHQERQDAKRKAAMNQILKRDFSLFMAYDTHEAAISLHKVSKKFEINQVPIQDVTSLKMKKSKKNNKKKNSSENVNDGNKIKKNQKTNTLQRNLVNINRERASKDTTPDHPFLRPIESVKKSIDTHNRKYRRSPDEIFDAKESTSNIHNLRLINKYGSTASQAKLQLDSGYEQYTPLNQSLKATRMMGSREFLLKELSDIHDTATNELENIDDCSELAIYSKIDLTKEKFNDDDLFEKQVILPPIEQIPSILNMKNEKLQKQGSVPDSILIQDVNDDQNADTTEASFDGIPKIKSGTEIETITSGLSNDISIADLSKNFVNDPGYFEYADGERTAMLTNKYLRVLEMLIDDSSFKPTPPSFSNDSQKQNTVESENEQIKSRISTLLRKAIPRHNTTEATPTKSKLNQNGGKQRKALFEDPDEQFGTIVAADGVEYKKSNCPEFSNVAFNGKTVLTNKPWETDIDKSSPVSSSGKKLKKRKHRNKNNNDEDSEYEYDDDDESEINKTSLPPPKFKIPGFDDDNNNSTINNSDHLMNQIDNFLSSSYSTVDDQQLLIDKLRQEASSSKNNSEEMRRTLMLLIDAVAHKYVLHQLDNNQHSSQISSLVDIDGASTARDVTSDDESAFSTIVIQKKLQKKVYRENRKFAAFDTNSRLVDPPEIIERKFTFTKDLLNAIAENAKFASTLKMKYYKDVTKMEPFMNMKSLAKRIREKLERLKKPHVIETSASYNMDKNNENEVILSIGGKNEKKQQKKAKLVKSRPSTAISKKCQNSDFSNLEVVSRPRTPLIDGCAKPEPGKIKTVTKPLVNNRKPKFTKMTPKFPNQPAEFCISKDFKEKNSILNNTKQFSKEKMLSGPPAKLKWNIPSDRINITDEDVDFFIFVTPYVMPPEVLNNILGK